jgi:lipoprotein-anchoring transpeptidase ErfK/SrfK
MNRHHDLAPLWISASRRFTAGRARVAVALIATLAAALAVADSVPFWGAKQSVPADTPINQLKKGQFLWIANAVTSGPMVMVVSITEQRAYVYRNGILIGVTSVSTGRPGHATPTGVFTVLQKQKEHRSTIYNGAPMPYMERLTWGGVALHAGGLPGYPESHGCIHLPTEFARELFDISPRGMTVVIGSDATEPRSVTHPGYLAPVSFVGGKPVDRTPLPTTEDDRWQPEASPSGPISIVLSRQSQRIVVYRNGIEIGRARITVSGDQPFATHALVLVASPSPFADPYVPDPTKYRWLRIGVPGHMGESGGDPDPETIGRIKIPADFVREVNAVLTPGTTVLVTDHAMSPHTTGAMMQVVDADPPATGAGSEHRG